MGGDGLAEADGVAVFVGVEFDVDVGEVAVEQGSELLADLIAKRSEAGAGEENRDVGVADAGILVHGAIMWSGHSSWHGRLARDFQSHGRGAHATVKSVNLIHIPLSFDTRSARRFLKVWRLVRGCRWSFSGCCGSVPS